MKNLPDMLNVRDLKFNTRNNSGNIIGNRIRSHPHPAALNHRSRAGPARAPRLLRYGRADYALSFDYKRGVTLEKKS
ncbi:hypothetical protein EVAR_63703_1 [Eumeta japonica]|uniref:Uncharacterized protein n=1 Tax=Eumeta variegata TaxID=151549 RepID=A0A4C1ZYA5_EUMVA|nr:hypothetical protein EVAR_63703_1 [Eumeta japonica]